MLTPSSVVTAQALPEAGQMRAAPTAGGLPEALQPGFLIAHYQLSGAGAQLAERAAALAVEQSVEMPLAGIADAGLRARVVARVGALDVASGRANLHLAEETVGQDPAQLLNMLFGNCSLQDDVTLLGVTLSAVFRARFPGSRFGIDGLRQKLGAPARPLTASALKPQGLPPADLARLAGRLARAGIDLIKDDHGIANQHSAPFAERVPAVQAAIAVANRETGRHTLYAPSLSGDAQEVTRQLDLLADEGVSMALACPFLLGVSRFAELTRHRHPVALMAHPALAGSPRIAPECLLGDLFPLFGADAVIFPNHGGRFSWSRTRCLTLAERIRSPGLTGRGALPIPAGGMQVERVEEMLDCYGRDVVLLIGGNLLAAPDLDHRARQFVDAAARWPASPTAGAAP